MPLPKTVPLKDGRIATVRSARAEDANAWIENANALGGERVFVMTEQFTRTRAEIQDQFRGANPESVLWLVAEIDGRVVGGADFHRGRWVKNAHTAELGVAVRKEWRGLGLGEALLRAGQEWARGLGVRKLKLAVFATNERALRLYRKLGFVEEGRLRGDVILDGRPVDTLLMALGL